MWTSGPLTGGTEAGAWR